MGKVASKLIKKPFRTFNIDNRAHRVIEKHQMNPKVAPKHPTTKDAIRQVQAGKFPTVTRSVYSIVT